MADYLSTLVAETLGAAPVIQPRVASRFQSEFMQYSDESLLALENVPVETAQTMAAPVDLVRPEAPPARIAQTDRPRPESPVMPETAAPALPETVPNIAEPVGALRSSPMTPQVSLPTLPEPSPQMVDAKATLRSLPTLVPPDVPRVDKPVSLLHAIARNGLGRRTEKESGADEGFDLKTPAPRSSTPGHASSQRSAPIETSGAIEENLLTLSSGDSVTEMPAQHGNRPKSDRSKSDNPKARPAPVPAVHEPASPRRAKTTDEPISSIPSAHKPISPRQVEATDESISPAPRRADSPETHIESSPASPLPDRLSRRDESATNPESTDTPPPAPVAALPRKLAPERILRTSQPKATERVTAMELVEPATAHQTTPARSTVNDMEERTSSVNPRREQAPDIKSAAKPLPEERFASQALVAPDHPILPIHATREMAPRVQETETGVPAVDVSVQSFIRPRPEPTIERQVSATPADRREAAGPEQEPAIRVSIGRVQVHGHRPPLEQTKRSETRRVLSLSDYLKQLKGGSR